jgi:hypothetical protein
MSRVQMICDVNKQANLHFQGVGVCTYFTLWLKKIHLESAAMYNQRCEWMRECSSFCRNKITICELEEILDFFPSLNHLYYMTLSGCQDLWQTHTLT